MTGDRGDGPRRRPGRRPAGGREDRTGRPPRGRLPWIDPAREAAYEAIAAVHRDDAYGNLVLPRILRERGITGRDAALATELTYGTLRMTGTLDAVIAAAANRPVDRIDPPARDALRLGGYQLLYTRVPRHAATATTVDLVRCLLPGASGFANAVLRRIGERSLDQWLEQVAPSRATDPHGHLAVVHAHPLWIVRALADALAGPGQRTTDPPVLEELAAALAANNRPPRVTLCARPGRITPERLAEATGGVRGRYGRYSVTLPSGAPGEVRAVVEGSAHVQDEGSQLVAEALANAPLGPGQRTGRWLDLCAGPGGKAGLLGAIAAGEPATVTAVELAPHRARLVELAVRGLPVEVIAEDGRQVGQLTGVPAGGFDRVLVDAPCSGLGALRRRPEARWRHQPSDLPALTRIQRELLAAGLRAARPGGVVAYVTCSPHPAETRVSVAAAARRAGVETRQIDARPLLPAAVPDLGDGPDVQLWPHRQHTDAMYLAVLQRLAQ